MTAEGKRAARWLARSSHFCRGFIIPSVDQLECVIFRLQLAIRTSELFSVRKFRTRHNFERISISLVDCRRLDVAASEPMVTIWANCQPFRHLTPPGATAFLFYWRGV